MALFNNIRRTFNDARMFATDVQERSRFVLPNGYWNHESPQTRSLVAQLCTTGQKERAVIARELKRVEVGSILDVGCGCGSELASYRAKNLDVKYVGLDGSKYMLEQARERHPTGAFVEGDAQSLPFADKCVDAVVLRHILEHLPSYERAIQEALRVSRELVVVNLFHRLLPGSRDVTFMHHRGYYDNWYSEKRFEGFLKSESAWFTKEFVDGTNNQTATVYSVRAR